MSHVEIPAAAFFIGSAFGFLLGVYTVIRFPPRRLR